MRVISESTAPAERTPGSGGCVELYDNVSEGSRKIIQLWVQVLASLLGIPNQVGPKTNFILCQNEPKC